MVIIENSQLFDAYIALSQELYTISKILLIRTYDTNTSGYFHCHSLFEIFPTSSVSDLKTVIILLRKATFPVEEVL
jgi:hypothetical protein